MGKLRRPVRLYVLAVVTVGALALAGTALLAAPATFDPVLAVTLLAVATVAQIQVVHVTAKSKVSVGDTAIFAAVLTLAAPVAMAIGAASTFVGLRFATKQPLYNRLFNASGTTLAAGASALTYAALSRGGDLLADPLTLALAAAAYYLTKASVTDLAIAIQLRRDPIRAWWPSHRRDLPFHAALYLLGVLAAVSADRATWTITLFLIPMALVLLALREATRLRQRTKEAIIQLADLIDQRDPYTYGHSQRVAAHANHVARRLRLTPERVEIITEAARMHDIGKVTTPDHILKKPTALDEREWMEMRRHCEQGHRLLQQIPDFTDGADLVLSHHERVDGCGYPRRINGADLPLEASIISVCDAYDAMTSDRVYRRALPHFKVVAELQSGRGAQWHERAVDALLELMHEGAVAPAARLEAPQVAAAG